MRKIFVVGYGIGYANWMGGKIVQKMQNADLVVFTGGADISPSIYGEKPHPTTYPNPERDAFEVEAFNTAVQLNKHIIGICRGAQLGCAMSGGKLIQDQGNPFHKHKLYTYDKKEIKMTSIHHQAMYPWGMPKDNFKLLAWTNNICGHHYGSDDTEMVLPDGKECEVVFFPKTKCLGIQGHPEMMFYAQEKNSVTFDWLNNVLDMFLKDTL